MIPGPFKLLLAFIAAPLLLLLKAPFPSKSVGFRMVLIIFLVLWMLWFELLCFIVIFNSVDSIPLFTLLLPPTWIVPEG